jgi:predicted transcriptional regulator
VSNTLASMNNQLNANKQGLLESANIVAQSSTAMRDMTAGARTSIDTLAQVANKIADASSAMQRTANESNESVTELAELVSTSVAEGNEMLEALKDTWVTQEQALAGADKELEGAFENITKNLEGSLGRLSEFSQNSSDKLSDVVTMLTTMVQDLQETVEELQTQTRP